MPLEIIVVDDASTDATAALAGRLSCRVLRHETMRGQVAGKNTGLQAAQGEYVLFHDHDDVMNEGALSKMRLELVADNDLYLVMAKVRDFFSPELDEETKRAVQIRTEPYYGLFTGAVLMRRSLFDLIGYFDEQITSGEIIALMAKMDAMAGVKHKKIDFIAANRRVHKTNYGLTHADKERQDYLKILRAKLRR